MSNSQKVLKVFGILELLMAVFAVVNIVQGGGALSWVSVLISLLAAYLLFAAAKDASKIMGAWLIDLVDLVLSVLSLILALNATEDKVVRIVGSLIAIVLNLIVFIAANNVKRQANK